MFTESLKGSNQTELEGRTHLGAQREKSEAHYSFASTFRHFSLQHSAAGSRVGQLGLLSLTRPVRRPQDGNDGLTVSRSADDTQGPVAVR